MSIYKFTSELVSEPTLADTLPSDSCAKHGHSYDDGYCEFCGIHEDEAEGSEA